MPSYHAVMFDLDGTLADTLADIAAAANFMLRTLGRPELPALRIGELIGHGAERLVRGALGPEHPHLVERGHELFRDYYARHGTDFTKPYPGVTDLLDELGRRGLKRVVYSNKHDAAVQQTLRDVLPTYRFDRAVGQLPGAPLKPDPTVALRIADDLCVPAGHWLYVGDSGVDMQTATNAGMFAVGVSWGFRGVDELRAEGAKVIINRADELLSLLS